MATKGQKQKLRTKEEKFKIIEPILNCSKSQNQISKENNINIGLINAWVKKYNELGQDGLYDKRGRPSIKESKKELTLEEKQAIEIEKLKRELECERMVNEVLKKNLEIRQKMERDSRLLGKRTNTKR